MPECLSKNAQGNGGTHNNSHGAHKQLLLLKYQERTHEGQLRFKHARLIHVETTGCFRIGWALGAVPVVGLIKEPVQLPVLVLTSAT